MQRKGVSDAMEPGGRAYTSFVLQKLKEVEAEKAFPGTCVPYVRQDDGGGGRERLHGRREGSRGNGIGNPTSESSLIIPPKRRELQISKHKKWEVL